MLKVALLDDYANAALASADWRRVAGAAELTVFDRHLSEAEAAAALAPFDVLSTIRERMALPASLLARLPNLKMIVIIGPSLPNLDMAAATANGVLVCTSDLEARRPLSANATPELTWGLLIAAARHRTQQERVMRAGGWQSKLGPVLAGRTL
ncbi:MAG: D-2-hydroxyacid dehydrogenase family protein, partial [Hyphomonadaceae bacterium]